MLTKPFTSTARSRDLGARYVLASEQASPTVIELAYLSRTSRAWCRRPRAVRSDPVFGPGLTAAPDAEVRTLLDERGAELCPGSGGELRLRLPETKQSAGQGHEK